MNPADGQFAIIPARGGSKRLPRKNIAVLAGKPLLQHVIENAYESGLFSTIVVSTEDSEIANIASDAGAEIHARPEELATDQSSVVQVCMDVLLNGDHAFERYERFCCIYPTAAFLMPSDLIYSRKLMDEPPSSRVIMGVSSYPIHPYKALVVNELGFLTPKWPEKNRLKSQAFHKMVASNGTFYWAQVKAFLSDPTFYPKDLKGYEVPAERAIDIDTPEDLEWAKKLAPLRW